MSFEKWTRSNFSANGVDIHLLLDFRQIDFRTQSGARSYYRKRSDEMKLCALQELRYR